MCVSVNTSGLAVRFSPNFLHLSSEPSVIVALRAQLLMLTNLVSEPQSPGLEGWVKHAPVTLSMGSPGDAVKLEP